MKKVLVIDNYDSFTYNLVHYIESILDFKVTVVRNDEISLEEIDKYDKILMSPGPGIPNEAGICLEMIKTYARKKSILGVCLGHQAIGEAFGGKLTNLSEVYHGIGTNIILKHKDEPLFKELPDHFEAGRYHSWVVSTENLPDDLMITCEDDQGMIMGLTHKNLDVRGVQFHPESVLTQNGLKMIENWLKH
ncbi:MAG: aminodeoxychorismate/anthranilate synthase component II [Bacteroidetes bacterium]|jgi:anthranilate synthase component 2|nr:aminodeoxychorismate/anthranilate synthase component II [Bacteroidota bacterium]